MPKRIFFFILFMFFTVFNGLTNASYEKLAYDFSFKDIDGTPLKLSEYKGKVIIVVNVASQCGFTSQYEDLQKLWDKYRKKGLIVIGLPSNQFGGQEPGSNTEIKNFCEVNFNVNFPLTTKINVKGENINSIYKWALENYGKKASPKWNFYKILINKEGKIEKTYSSITNPMSKKITDEIEILLNIK